MKLRRVSALLALVLSLATFVALAGFADAQPQTLTLQLDAQNNSGQSGPAELTDLGNGSTRVVVTLSNAPSNVPQPIHFHTGTCATLGAIVYPLTSLVNGRSESMVNVSIAQLLAAPFAINAHRSAQEASVYVACGNVVVAAQQPTAAAPQPTVAPQPTAAPTAAAQQPSAAPRTGGGGLASPSSPLPWLAGATLLVLIVVGAAYLSRHRAA